MFMLSFQWFEEEMPLILKNEQIKFHKALSAGSPEESPRLKDENEGQKRISDAFLNFVGVCLRESKKETMADRLWGSKFYSTALNILQVYSCARWKMEVTHVLLTAF